MSGVFSVVARMKHLLATPATPPAGQSNLYFKSDGLPYSLGPDGIEHPLVEGPNSLHANPTFDQVSGGKPVAWDDHWMSAGGVLSSDNSAGNFVSGYSAKVIKDDDSNSRLITATAFPVTDQQMITFAVWAKRSSAVPMTLSLEMVSNTTAGGADYFQTGAASSGSAMNLTTTWARYACTFSVPPGHLFARFSLNPYNVLQPAPWSGTVWYDESSSFATVSPPGADFPPGTTVMTAGQAAPNGWLLCQGQAVSRTDYAALFGVIGTAFGPGDGSTTFNIPDFQGRFPIGMNPGSGNSNHQVVGGTEIGTGTSGATLADREERLNHVHDHTGANLVTNTFSHNLQTNTTATAGANRLSGPTDHSHNVSGTTGTRGLMGGTIQQHALLVLNFMIKT